MIRTKTKNLRIWVASWRFGTHKLAASCILEAATIDQRFWALCRKSGTTLSFQHDIAPSYFSAPHYIQKKPPVSEMGPLVSNNLSGRDLLPAVPLLTWGAATMWLLSRTFYIVRN